MSEHAVHVDGLVKVFDVPEREAGLAAAAKGLVRRKTREVRAVDEIVRNGKFASVGDRIVIVAGSSLGTPRMLNGVLIHTIGGEPEHLSEGAPPMVQTEEEM